MIKIIADSTCDLSKDLIEKYKVIILPLHILLGEKEYRDGVDITPDEIFTWSDANRTTPKTSAVGFEEALELFKKELSDGSEAIVFTISESMSTTFNVLNLVADELDMTDRISVINSQNLSTGIGLQVISAAIKANEGLSRAEIVKYLSDVTPRVRASFVVDTLTYLHRGGRCSGLAALAGGVLKLHPRIVVKKGVMSADKKYRGKLSRVILNYVEDLVPVLKNAEPDRVFITHSGCDKEIVDSVKEKLAALNIFSEILETRAGGVISSHCGPGTLGVLFIEK